MANSTPPAEAPVSEVPVSDQPSADVPAHSRVETPVTDPAEAAAEKEVDTELDDLGKTAKEKAHMVLSNFWNVDEVTKIIQELERRGLALVHVKQ